MKCRGATEKSSLAIFGGVPVIASSGRHYVWPRISKRLENDVVRQLHNTISIYDRSGVFEKFEDAFANYHHRRHALLCSSGTAAIHSMFVAAGFRAGDEVICPAYTFFATVTPLLFTGAKPVLCDCDENGNIDPAQIEGKITSRTKGVVITHMWGIPCDMRRITALCKKYKIVLMEDCSHAHGARYKGSPVGSFGDLAVWSIQGPKNVTGGEGGVLATNNDEYYYKALLLGHYNKRSKQEIPKYHPLYRYALTGMGLKYRAHPLATVIAFSLFKRLDRDRKTRDIFARMIIRGLSDIDGLAPPKINALTTPSWYALVFQYDAGKFGGLPIERFCEALHAEGLSEIDRPMSTSPLNLLPLFQHPRQLFPSYKKYPFTYRAGDFPHAEAFYRNAVKLPVWTEPRDKRMVENYIQGIKKVATHYRELL